MKEENTVSKKLEIQAGNLVTEVFKLKKNSEDNFYRFHNLYIPRPTNTKLDYHHTQIDNLLIDIKKDICILVEAKWRSGISYMFTKWSKQRKAIYLSKNMKPPQTYYWVNPGKTNDIYIDGIKQYRSLIRQFNIQKEFLIKSDKDTLNKALSLEGDIYDKIYDIIRGANFRYVFFTNNLKTGNRFNLHKINLAKVRDILILSNNYIEEYLDNEILNIQNFIWH